MSRMVFGSKVLSSWFDGDDPNDWTIYNLLDAMQKSIINNVVKQTEIPLVEAAELQKMNEPLVWAYRELLCLKNEVLEMQGGGGK